MTLVNENGVASRSRGVKDQLLVYNLRDSVIYNAEFVLLGLDLHSITTSPQGYVAHSGAVGEYIIPGCNHSHVVVLQLDT